MLKIFSVLSCFITVVFTVIALVICIKSKAVSKPISITLLMLYSIPALLTSVYAYYACFFTAYSCNESFWFTTLIIVMILYVILVFTQIIYVQHKNSKAQVQSQVQVQVQSQAPAQAAGDVPVTPSNVIIIRAPTERKSIPTCPEVSGSNVKAPKAMVDCLRAGLVYVDGACAPPQEYGVVPGDEYLKRCYISCGQNYMTLDGSKKLCSV